MMLQTVIFPAILIIQILISYINLYFCALYQKNEIIQGNNSTKIEKIQGNNLRHLIKTRLRNK